MMMMMISQQRTQFKVHNHSYVQAAAKHMRVTVLRHAQSLGIDEFRGRGDCSMHQALLADITYSFVANKMSVWMYACRQTVGVARCEKVGRTIG